MPRQARIDYAGALHHIMVRGMERTAIFKDDDDRKEFLDRLKSVCGETETACLSFALMPNHFHLLCITGATPISRTMQKLLTGYAVYFNIRHRRKGRLYQNRFKSILCDAEKYLLELVRYIHLNPVRGRVVPDIQTLDRYAWSSHTDYVGNPDHTWLAKDEVLSYFSRNRSRAIREYRGFIQAGLGIKEPVNFEGGGLVRSLGGTWEVMKKRKRREIREAADERILGSGEFVEDVLKNCKEVESKQSNLLREGWDMRTVISRAAEVVGVPVEELYQKGRKNKRARGRALACKWLIADLKQSRVSVAREFGISGTAVYSLAAKGRGIEKMLKVSIQEGR